MYHKGQGSRDTGSAVREADPRVRLNRYLARTGYCSRREADELIAKGRVTVDGEVATPGTRVMPDGSQAVRVGGKLLEPEEKNIVVAYYKPYGVTCTDRDPHATRTLKEAFKYPVRLTYAGRLDRDSEGLLLMTNDGELIEAMMRGSNGHEKEYIVRTRRKIMDGDLIRMRRGMKLTDPDQRTKPCKIERLEESSFRIILTQGLNRQIRRMVKACGNEVKDLKRIRVLSVELGGLKPGQLRRLSNEELRTLYYAAGLRNGV